MKWTPDPELKQRLITSLTKKHIADPERLKHIHVTDLTYCLREAYFRKINPKPATEQMLGFFVDGSRRHLIIQDLHGTKAEVKIGGHGVRATVDLLDDFPIEIKTSRGRPALTPIHIEQRYGLQIAYYMLLTEKNEARFIIQWLNPKPELQDPTFECYKVEFEPGEAELYLTQLQTDRGLLKQALSTQNPRLLPRVKAEKSWKCRACQYAEECSKIGE